MEEFARRHGQLRDDLLTQGDRVVSHAMHAIESFFGNDLEKAGSVIEADRVIDRADIEIERASIKLLMLSPTEEYDIRSVFTIVKINNEFERIADCGVNIAEATSAHDGDAPRSGTFEVMANSVIGMVRDANLLPATATPLWPSESSISMTQSIDSGRRSFDSSRQRCRTGQCPWRRRCVC